MTDQTTEPLSRIERIKQAHPEIDDVKIRGMLVCQYDKVSRDPSTRGPEGLQIQLECYTDLLIKMTPQAILNEVARVSEFFPSWDDLAERMTYDDK
jgi:hypothetical protein